MTSATRNMLISKQIQPRDLRDDGLCKFLVAAAPYEYPHEGCSGTDIFDHFETPA